MKNKSSHLDTCALCAEHGGIEAVRGLSAEHQAELMAAFDQMVADGRLTDAQVAELIITLGHHAFKIVRTGSKEDRGVITASVADVLKAMRRTQIDVRAGEAKASGE
jgi:hypothetical protein